MIRPAISVRGKTNMSVIKEYPELENVEITPTLEDQIVKSDMYGFDEVKVKGVSSYIDEDIKPEYIKEGVDILGVVGNFKGIDTSDATIDPSQMLVGKTAYVNGEKIEGTMPNNGQLNYEPSKDPQVIPSGYTDGGSISGIVSEELNLTPGTEDQIHEGKLFDKVTMLGDANLLPENIKKGTTIFKITGSNTVVDTSDATALVTDIIVGKTAYVNGEKVEGTYEPLDTSDANATADDIMKNKTAYVNGEKIVGTLETASDSSKNILANTEGFDEIPQTWLNSNHFSIQKTLKEVDLSDSDFSGITQYTNAFSNCATMTKLKLPTITGAQTTYRMFKFCCMLEEVPYFDTSLVTNMGEMFAYCKSLITVPTYDASSVTDVDAMLNMFENCESLSDDSLNNILAMCVSAVNKTYGKSLTNLGLTAAQIERCKSLSNYQAFLDAGWAA